MAEAIATQSQLQTLLSTGTNYDNWLAWLRSVRPRYVGTPMLAKIDAKIAEGEKTKGAIGSVLTTVKDAWKWIQESGSGALDAIRQATGLGFLPAIPAVWAYGLGATAVAGAITGMTVWIRSTSELKRELDSFDMTVQKALDKGASPTEAIKAASEAITGIVGGEATRAEAGDMGNQLIRTGGKVLLWVVLAFGSYKFAQKQGWVQ